MSEYRDDLRAAHDRIAHLEAALAKRDAPPQRAGKYLGLSLAIGVVIVGGIGAIGVVTAIMMHTRRTAVEPMPPSPAPSVATAVMTWYPQALVTPAFVDVDGDGAKDVIGLAWEYNHDEAALHAFALDRNSYEPKWVTAGYAAQWNGPLVHEAVLGDRLVVTDDLRLAHIIDLKTGHETSTVSLPTMPRYLCFVKGDASRILYSEQVDGEGAMSLTLATGDLASAGKDEKCGVLNHAANVIPCATCDVKPDASITSKAKTKGFWSNEILAEGDNRVSLGFASNAEHESQEIGIGWSAETKAVHWESPLVPPHDEKEAGHITGLAPLSVLSSGKLYYMFQGRANRGAFRLVARDATEGTILYAVDVPDTAEGTLMTSLAADGDDLFLVMGQVLHVMDAKTGTQRRAIHNLDVPSQLIPTHAATGGANQ